MCIDPIDELADPEVQAMVDRLYGRIPPIGHTTAIAVETLRAAAALLRRLAAERDGWEARAYEVLDTANAAESI